MRTLAVAAVGAALVTLLPLSAAPVFAAPAAVVTNQGQWVIDETQADDCFGATIHTAGSVHWLNHAVSSGKTVLIDVESSFQGVTMTNVADGTVYRGGSADHTTVRFTTSSESATVSYVVRARFTAPGGKRFDTRWMQHVTVQPDGTTRVDFEREHGCWIPGV